jgi:AP endonuclease-2
MDKPAVDTDVLNQIPPKIENAIRLVSFNVNGIKTLFNYHPWNSFNQDLNSLFNCLHGDIITLQELKVTQSSLGDIKNIAHLNNFKSFISIPKTRKGYSGVGVFVRVPQSSHLETVAHALTVVKAEEGISGYLSSPSKKGYCYRDLPENESIGGYPKDLQQDLGLSLDSEGRCVVVELACNIVIFSVYCPANSMATEEGEVFRLEFLSYLFTRAKNLHDRGKHVVVMGDINVSLDLIDNAEGIQERLAQDLIKLKSTGRVFETVNFEECIKFKSSKPSRMLLNKYVVPTIDVNVDETLNLDISHPNQFLYDTTRLIQNRRMNMYTVWNTLKDNRRANIGSRIDLILSTKFLSTKIDQADIWPFILGSDHCPVFTDFKVDDEWNIKLELPTIPKNNFEAKYFYKLTKPQDIFAMFTSKRKSNTVVESEQLISNKESGTVQGESKSSSESLSESSSIPSQTNADESIKITKKRKLQYTSRKAKKPTVDQQPINNFFLPKT